MIVADEFVDREGARWVRDLFGDGLWHLWGTARGPGLTLDQLDDRHGPLDDREGNCRVCEVEHPCWCDDSIAEADEASPRP